MTAGPGLHGDGLLMVVGYKLHAEVIYEHVEGVEAVAGTGVGSVGIHDHVGIVRILKEKLHE